MNPMKIFEHESFGKVRVVEIEGEPWFVGKDVAVALAYTNPQKAIRDHVDMEDRTVNDSFIVNGTRGLLINESGLYSLILTSRLPTAKRFKRWITKDVLPSIRKHGGYLTLDKLKEILEDPQHLALFLEEMLKLLHENYNLKDEVKELKPKAQYFEEMMYSGYSINFRTTAKEIGIKPMYFISFLLDRKYLYRNKKKELLPYQVYVEDGLFEIKEFCGKHGHKGSQTLVTPLGRAYFLNLYMKGVFEQGANRNVENQ